MEFADERMPRNFEAENLPAFTTCRCTVVAGIAIAATASLVEIINGRGNAYANGRAGLNCGKRKEIKGRKEKRKGFGGEGNFNLTRTRIRGKGNFSRFAV